MDSIPSLGLNCFGSLQRYKFVINNLLYHYRDAERFREKMYFFLYLFYIEILDKLVENAVPVNLGFEVQENRAKAQRGAVHQHKLARRVQEERNERPLES